MQHDGRIIRAGYRQRLGPEDAAGQLTQDQYLPAWSRRRGNVRETWLSDQAWRGEALKAAGQFAHGQPRTERRDRPPDGGARQHQGERLGARLQ